MKKHSFYAGTHVAGVKSDRSVQSGLENFQRSRGDIHDSV